MAKTGFKGFGGFAGSGADSTLVGAAFNAAMAGVPKDYTKIFNNISSHYDKAMQKVGEGWVKVTEAVGKMGEVAINEFKKKQDLDDALGNSNEGFQDSFEERLNFIKNNRVDTFKSISHELIELLKNNRIIATIKGREKTPFSI